MDTLKETVKKLTKPTVNNTDTIAEKEARKLKKKAKRKRDDGQIAAIPREEIERRERKLVSAQPQASFKALRKLLNKRNQIARK